MWKPSPSDRYLRSPGEFVVAIYFLSFFLSFVFFSFSPSLTHRGRRKCDKRATARRANAMKGARKIDTSHLTTRGHPIEAHRLQRIWLCKGELKKTKCWVLGQRQAGRSHHYSSTCTAAESEQQRNSSTALSNPECSSTARNSRASSTTARQLKAAGHTNAKLASSLRIVPKLSPCPKLSPNAYFLHGQKSIPKTNSPDGQILKFSGISVLCSNISHHHLILIETSWSLFSYYFTNYK